MWSMAHHEKNLPDTYQCVAGALLASCGWVDTLLYTLTRKALINGGGNASNRRTRSSSNNHAKSSKDDPSSIDAAHGGSILQTRTVTISANQIYALDTIDEDHRGRAHTNHHYHKKSFGGERAGHSPTGSLDPIFSGQHRGDKVGSEVVVSSAAVVDVCSDDDDGTSRVSSFEDVKAPHAR